MGWLIVLAVLVLLALIPLGVSARYSGAGVLVLVTTGPMRFQVCPGKKKRKEKPAVQKKRGSRKTAAQEKTESNYGGSVRDFVPLVKRLLDFLTDFQRKLRVDRLELNLILAGGDPCDLAINYGKACAAMGNLWPRLEQLFVIKKRDVRIQCDFEASETLVTARLDLTITLGRLLWLCGLHGVRILKEFIALKNKRKGGATI